MAALAPFPAPPPPAPLSSVLAAELRQTLGLSTAESLSAAGALQGLFGAQALTDLTHLSQDELAAAATAAGLQQVPAAKLKRARLMPPS
jgi:hypothetical protein